MALYRRLASEFGTENVGAELASGAGTRVDLVVRRAQQPVLVLRNQDGSLTEGVHPRGTRSTPGVRVLAGGQEASRLIIVGEFPLDEECEQYVRRLRSQFSLPVYYEHINL